MTNEKIPFIPELPLEIKEAINNQNFVIFLGAGASSIIGCKDWEHLAENLVEKCFKTPKLGNIDSKCINFKERESLLQIKDPKKIITICKHILEKNEALKEFYYEIEKSLEPESELLEYNIYNELYGLRGLFITTNIDKHFDKKFNKSQIVCRQGSFNSNEIDRTKLYHIHGRISEPTTLILTVKEYLDRYSNDKDFRTFLKKIFSDNVILFIGYGFNEYEVLDFLVTKVEISVPEKPKNFILRPYYSWEETLLEFEKYYFEQLGVQVLAFNKDELGYLQLFPIIQKWTTEITQTSSDLYNTFDELRNAAINYDPKEESRILQLITEDSFKLEFLRQLSQSGNPIPWLRTLKDNEYFIPKIYPMNSRNFSEYLTQMSVLENIAKINSQNPTENVTDDLITIINKIIDYKDENNQRIENDWIDHYIVKIIFLLPLDLIGDNYFDYIRKCLESKYDPILISGEIKEILIPKLIENNAEHHILKILDIIFEFKKHESPGIEDYSSLIDHFYLEEIVKTDTEDIIRICGLKAVDIALQKIEKVISVDSSEFHEIWIPSIYENNREDRDDSQLIHFVWLGFSFLNPIQIRETIKELLTKKHPIFRRIGICAIDHNYAVLKDLFWDLTDNPLDEYHARFELYELLKNHCKEFSKDEINKTIQWIETKIYHEDKLSIDPKEKEMYLAHLKKEWFSAILESDDPNVKKIYMKYHKIYPREIEHPEKRTNVRYLSKTVSPITKENFVQKTNADIIQFLNNFKVEGPDWGRVSSRALCDVFKESIVENPQRFTEDLDIFVNLKRPYQYGLLIGITDAWRADKDFKWDNIFGFINTIIESDLFWNEVFHEGESNYRNWIISQIADLIDEGTRRDNHLFDLTLLPQAEKILLILVQRSNENLFEMGDLMTSVLNSSKGKIYSAMVNYSLCYARHYLKDSDARLSEPIKEEFTKRLDPKIEQSVEFSVTLGKFLANLCYLDKRWVKENFNKIFPKEDETHWKAAFTGYLSYSGTVYVKIYNLLKSNGHYSKALNTEFKDPHITEHLVQQICIGYMEGLENLDDKASLINQMINIWNSDHITELIRFLKWFNKDSTSEKKRKVIDLWRVIILKTSLDFENTENNKILSELNGWISIIDELDEESCGWLIRSAKFVKIHNFDFIEQLIRHTEKSPKYTGNIFLSMLSGGRFFEYRKEDVIRFVTLLSDKGEKDNVVRISNLYLVRGFDFLNPILKHNLDK
ncbi:MAG: SIR2 family protein [Methanoregula sp.]